MRYWAQILIVSSNVMTLQMIFYLQRHMFNSAMEIANASSEAGDNIPTSAALMGQLEEDLLNDTDISFTTEKEDLNQSIANENSGWGYKIIKIYLSIVGILLIIINAKSITTVMVAMGIGIKEICIDIFIYLFI